jgi:hypothetical protein
VIPGQNIRVSGSNPMVQELNGNLEVFPNPFKGETTLRLEFPSGEDLTVEIMSMNGQLIRSLYNGRVEAAVPLELSFKADGISDGIYIARAFTESGMVLHQKIIVLK